MKSPAPTAVSTMSFAAAVPIAVVVVIAGVVALVVVAALVVVVVAAGLEPVSYTHLDVYKRQGRCRPDGSPSRRRRR